MMMMMMIWLERISTYFDSLMHEDVVRSQTRLSGIFKLVPSQSIGYCVQVHSVVDISRTKTDR